MLRDDLAPLVKRYGVDAIVEDMGQYLWEKVKSTELLRYAKAREGQKKRSVILLALAKVLRAL